MEVIPHAKIVEARIKDPSQVHLVFIRAKNPKTDMDSRLYFFAIPISTLPQM